MIPPTSQPLTVSRNAAVVPRTRQRSLLAALSVAFVACALAYLSQVPNISVMDAVTLPIMCGVTLLAIVGVLTRLVSTDLAARVTYVAFGGYLLLSLHDQLVRASLHTHMLSQAVYWFAAMYCVAFSVWNGRTAARAAGALYLLSLLLGVADLIYVSRLQPLSPLLLNYLGQFYLSGLVAILPLYHLTSLREHYGHVQRVAQLDGLTGLYNRGHGEELLANQHRGAPGLAVLFFDLDHFKQINDHYGHEAGDRVLKAVAQTLLAQLAAPNQGYGVRWGGEEFLIILPDSHGDDRLHRQQVQQLAEQLRARIAQLHQTHGVPPVTASFGLVMRRAGEGPEALVQRADEALYQAKHQGRNRVLAPTLF